MIINILKLNFLQKTGILDQTTDEQRDAHSEHI